MFWGESEYLRKGVFSGSNPGSWWWIIPSHKALFVRGWICGIDKIVPLTSSSSKNTKETTFLEMDPHRSPSFPAAAVPEALRQRHGARLEHCGASNLPRLELRATWLGRVQCRCQATSTWSGRCLEKPRLAPGAGEIWLVKSQGERKGGKVPKKWGMLCGWFVFSIIVGVQVLLFNMLGTFSKHRGQAKSSTIRWYVSFFGRLGPGK